MSEGGTCEQWLRVLNVGGVSSGLMSEWVDPGVALWRMYR